MYLKLQGPCEPLIVFVQYWMNETFCKKYFYQQFSQLWLSWIYKSFTILDILQLDITMMNVPLFLYHYYRYQEDIFHITSGPLLQNYRDIFSGSNNVAALNMWQILLQNRKGGFIEDEAEMSDDDNSSDDSDGSHLDRLEASFINDFTQCTQTQASGNTPWCGWRFSYKYLYAFNTEEHFL